MLADWTVWGFVGSCCCCSSLVPRPLQLNSHVDLGHQSLNSCFWWRCNLTQSFREPRGKVNNNKRTNKNNKSDILALLLGNTDPSPTNRAGGDSGSTQLSPPVSGCRTVASGGCAWLPDPERRCVHLTWPSPASRRRKYTSVRIRRGRQGTCNGNQATQQLNLFPVSFIVEAPKH